MPESHSHRVAFSQEICSSVIIVGESRQSAIVIPINVGQRINTSLNFAFSKSALLFALYAWAPRVGRGPCCVYIVVIEGLIVADGNGVLDVKLVVVVFVILKRAV